MNKLLELLWAVVMALIMGLYGGIKALIPASFLPKKDVKGKIVLITGAGSGLGRMMSVRFARLGCKLVLWDVNTAGNEETARLVKQTGAEAHTFTVDCSKRLDIYAAADKVKSDVGNVDILINNAGIVTGKKFMSCPDELIEKTMEVNINAHFWTVKSFLPSMLKRNHGHVVSIASGAGFNGVSGLCDYCASKFAAVGFDESLRNELISLGKDGVKTTVVCPYYINTGMFDGVQTKYPQVLPILDPEYVINKIMDAVLTNQEILMIPRVLYVFLYLKSFLPAPVYTYLGNVMGVNSSMDVFTGRKKQD